MDRSSKLFIELDKTGAEWVVVAYLSGDAQMLKVVESGESPHPMTGHLISGVPIPVIEKEDKLIGHRHISQDEMLTIVRQTADVALSNALYDLYASDNLLRRDELWPALIKSWIAVILFLAAVAGAALAIPWDRLFS